MSESLAFAALVVSVIVAILQWKQDQRIAALEKERRLAELAPRLMVAFEPLEREDRLRFVNQGPLNYDAVDVAMVAPDGDEGPIDALMLPGPSRGGSLGEMRLGAERAVVVRRHSRKHGGTVRFVVSCSARDRGKWETVAECEVPPDVTPWVF